ncbi:MAG TPA: hypothetical protein VGR22_03400 [Thermomicrobiales bacterium]|nr:hypothetical protein [Thermomicrobiales bacterium]
MTAQRCLAPGCGRFVRAGAVFCDRHEAADVVPVIVDDAESTRPHFRERLEQGEYAGLFDEHLSRVLTQAAVAVSERGLVDEIGALRVVLARLLMEEEDLTKLASNGSRALRSRQRGRNGRSAGMWHKG